MWAHRFGSLIIKGFPERVVLGSLRSSVVFSGDAYSVIPGHTKYKGDVSDVNTDGKYLTRYFMQNMLTY